MPHNKPFHRNFRELVQSESSSYSSRAYIVDKGYAKSPHHYTRAFLILQQDIRNLFEYIEPADTNLNTFSYKIYELLVRTCIEVEANFKAIFRENIFIPTYVSGSKAGQQRTEKYWNIKDYELINKTHHLDNYFVEFPFWRGEKFKYQPFLEWQNSNGSLAWYQAYNGCKHDRDEKFELANLENLLNAFSGLFVLLSSQFNCESFNPGGTSLSLQIDSYFEGKFGIGDYLKIKFPTNWQESEKYDFDWLDLKNEDTRFEKFDYNNIR